MSNYAIETKSYLEDKGVDVVVHMGWDNPCQGFFMYVECEDQSYVDNPEELMYGNLYDVGIIDNLDYFLRKLQELKITVPEHVIAQVRADRKITSSKAHN